MIGLDAFVNGLGIVVGLGALSLAVWTITVYRELYNSSFVSALYIIGLIILFLSLEVHPDEGVSASLGRLAIFVAVGYWEVVCLREVWTLDPEQWRAERIAHIREQWGNDDE